MFKTFQEFLKEEDDTESAYGAKDSVRAETDKEKSSADKGTEAKLNQEDKDILADVLGKLQRGIELFSELEYFLKSYQKLNIKTITDILDRIKVYHESVEKEMNNL